MLDTLRSSAILYVTSGSASGDQLALARQTGATIVRIGELSAEHLASDPSLVVDIDLRKIELVRRLKVILARRGAGCRIFLIDPDSRVTTVHANVLGGDCLLPRPAAADDIHGAIRRHFGIHRAGLADSDVRASIDAGVDALGDGFRALRSDTQFDADGARRASGTIADAIDEIGVDDWLATVKGYHMGTFQHCMLVTGVASAFASQAGMGRSDVTMLTLAGLLHDIGKAAVPVAILDKPGALTHEEMQVIRTHPVVGHDYLRRRSEFAAEALSSVRHHHEYLDGSGYPDGLKAADIDDVTRIITICDIYAALIERRSYKEAKTPAQAMIILNAMAASGKVETSLVRELGRIMLARQSA